jgi:hypothetical protein
MTCVERMRRIRLMEKMEKSNRTIETNGVMKYCDHNGKIMITAKTVMRNEAR